MMAEFEELMKKDFDSLRKHGVASALHKARVVLNEVETLRNIGLNPARSGEMRIAAQKLVDELETISKDLNTAPLGS
jgi:division protein CdvB (Snf7/Vps24/ESCRT-III family)